MVRETKVGTEGGNVGFYKKRIHVTMKPLE